MNLRLSFVAFIAALCLIGSVLITVARAIGQGQPPPENLQAMHLTDCALPCWLGITAGETSFDDAIQALERIDIEGWLEGGSYAYTGVPDGTQIEPSSLKTHFIQQLDFPQSASLMRFSNRIKSGSSGESGADQQPRPTRMRRRGG